MPTEIRVVDNRVFLLGLDDLYREAMKRHERGELLACAVATAETLGVSPADVPLEGYYGEDDELTHYFQLIRALQNVPQHRESELQSHAEFQRLKQVTSSPMFGAPSGQDSILPAGADALTEALRGTFPNWTIQTITDAAYAAAAASDDYSLVALAALSRDAVALTALRESVVLYAMALAGCAGFENPQYEWRVDEVLANRARKFVGEFNRLFSEALPAPDPQNARAFWIACKAWKVLGRCVRIGLNDAETPVRHYHWAVSSGPDHELIVKDFWDSRIWTTDEYRKKRGDFVGF